MAGLIWESEEKNTWCRSEFCIFNVTNECKPLFAMLYPLLRYPSYTCNAAICWVRYLICVFFCSNHSSPVCAHTLPKQDKTKIKSTIFPFHNSPFFNFTKSVVILFHASTAYKPYIAFTTAISCSSLLLCKESIAFWLLNRCRSSQFLLTPFATD